MLSVTVLAQNEKPESSRVYLGLGFSGQFFLNKGGGRPIGGYPQGAQQSTEGIGITTPLTLSSRKISFHYDPVFRYDVIRINVRVPAGSSDSEKVKEMIIDHHFAIRRHFGNTYIGLGYSIFTANKGYEWTYRVFLNGLNQPSTEISKYLKLKVNTYDLVIGQKFNSNIDVTTKLMYAPTGSIKWDPYLNGILLNLSMTYNFKIH